MREGLAGTIYRADYEPPAFSILTVALDVRIFEGRTEVIATLVFERLGSADGDLMLDGENLALQWIELDDSRLNANRYEVTENALVIRGVPDSFTLKTCVEICPEDNTSLEGFYRSQSAYCTQCEAEGFRKITYFVDRPDMLAVYTVSLEADSSLCPVLLSNGNLVSEESLAAGRHRAVWHDPFPKPSYLFAMVAGDLKRVSDQFKTRSGRWVDLHIWVEEKDIAYCDYAMRALQAAMQWDEEVYGLEYDLDQYNIVAVDDFNMGAMENKSLNVFNTSCVLAHPDITTDAGFQRVEAVVAHEYFHNYSGNRVTCRDWFQLSLKEGFTVFRDAEFSADMNSRGVKRVEDVAFLRTHQFAEDAGPLAHPVRPDAFVDISNFYTLTVYEKGAEVVRMLHTLLGADTFLAGAALYFDRFDGQAVTCDDFVDCMAEVSGRDLSLFRRWYEQAGTPEIQYEGRYDAAEHQYYLTLRQSSSASAGQGDKPPLLIPVATGLLVEGQPLDLGEGTTRVIELCDSEQTFVFDGIHSPPVPSLLRGFSAPVRMGTEQPETELEALMGGDDDAFVAWDAAQTLLARSIESLDMTVEAKVGIDAGLLAAATRMLTGPMDAAMKALTLTLPGEEYLADRASQRGLVDMVNIHLRRQRMKVAMGQSLSQSWLAALADNPAPAMYSPAAGDIGVRALRYLARDYLLAFAPHDLGAPLELLEVADNLTDRLTALRWIVQFADAELREKVLADFYGHWRHESLVINQWFALQATRPSPDCVESVIALLAHDAFDWRNPNKLRALISAFATSNPIAFHRKDGAGYQLLGDVVERVQATNPQIAARLLTPLTRWRRYATGQEVMRGELERIAGIQGLPKDVFEVVSRSLADPD
ncbi:MAG: aminopeptidase N [Luminiphilus sp.]|nr:aminopeptidase N [Luminiphilus sp.]